MSARLEYTSEHRQFREMVHDFVQQTVVPAHEQWEKAGCLDRSLFTEAGKLGLLAFSVPEEFGGAGVDDFRYNAIVVDELQRAGAAAEAIALSLQNDIVLPYLTDLTTAEQKQRWLPGVVTGETVIGIAMTEPGAGSDLAGIRTTAVRETATTTWSTARRPLSPTGRPEICSSSPRAPRPTGTRGCRCWWSSRKRRASAAAGTWRRSVCTPRTPVSSASPTCGFPSRTCSAKKAGASIN